MTQRDLMRHLWRSHASDEERVVREYAAREESGEVARGSNRNAVPPLEYARRLLEDGLREGWLDGTPRSSTPRPPATSPPGVRARSFAPASVPSADGLTRLQ